MGSQGYIHTQKKPVLKKQNKTKTKNKKERRKRKKKKEEVNTEGTGHTVHETNPCGL